MTLATLHRDGFEVEFAHYSFYKPVTIHDNTRVSSSAEGGTRTIRHHDTGDSAGLASTACVLKPSTRPFKARFILLPDFDFRASNAVLFGLTIVTANGSQERDFSPILKEEMTFHPNVPSEFPWEKVPMSEADKGTMTITDTRGNSNAEMASFVPQGEPYTVQVAWRLSSGSQVPKSQLAQSEHVADSGNSSKMPITRRSARVSKQNESTQPTQVQNATKPQASRHCTTNFGSFAQPTADTQERSSARSSGGSEIVVTAPNAIIDFEKTPERRPNIAARRRAFDIGSTPTLAGDITGIRPHTLERNANAAPGPHDDHIKRLRFRLRKAEAVLEVAKAKAEETGSQVDKDDAEYLQASLSQAEAVHDLARVEVELKEADCVSKDLDAQG
jgi:hypothetical protein